MFILEPFVYEFFTHGIIAATMVGALTGLLGVFIVLRRMSYIGHGLSHATFGGAVVSFVMQWNFYIGAGLWGFVSALLINRITTKQKIGADAAIGIVTTASFALGVAVISRVRHFTQNFEAALFGNVLGVTVQDLWVITLVGIVVVITLFFTYKKLVFLTFDPEVSRAYNVPVELMDTFFSLLLAATIIASIQVMGVTLIAASVVIPASSARLLTNSFSRMLFASTLIGAFCGFVGMYISFYLNIASGATIVLFSTCVFIAISILKSSQWRFLTREYTAEESI